jgi:hypothetical protein
VRACEAQVTEVRLIEVRIILRGCHTVRLDGKAALPTRQVAPVSGYVALAWRRLVAEVVGTAPTRLRGVQTLVYQRSRQDYPIADPPSYSQCPDMIEDR